MNETAPTKDSKATLRRGWTTGACAAAAAAAAAEALLSGHFPDPVEISLPGGQRPAFPLVERSLSADLARAGVTKDAGDDPDVTHGATVLASVRRLPEGRDVAFKAGPGVGTVTLPGLPLAVGEPAINPAPRALIAETLAAVARRHGSHGGFEVEIAIPGGEALAAKTLNGRLGIKGGLSILGTTGIVVPYSCASWIHSIHRGIDVARAAGIEHALGATGATSERAGQAALGLSEQALIDMGDFAGGMLKYLRRHPIPKVTIAGGFAKLGKLAQGAVDLHSARSRVDLPALRAALADLGAEASTRRAASETVSAAQILSLAEAARLPLGAWVAQAARTRAQALAGDQVAVSVLVYDRAGREVGRAGL